MTAYVKSIVFHPEVLSTTARVRTNTAYSMQWHQLLNRKRNCSIKSL